MLSRFDVATAANEYDGVCHFFKTGEEAKQLFDKACAAVAPMGIKAKEYPEPLKYAKEKYPNADWGHINSMSAEEWLKAYRRCMDASSADACRNIDTVFGDVVRGSTHFFCYQPPG